MSDPLLKEIDDLRAEVARLEAITRRHPAVEALRFVAPFIRDAISAGTWKAGPGTKAVEHELAAMWKWLKDFEGDK